MDDMYPKDEKHSFSNDPQEDLRIDNEILKLKMMAERGAKFDGDMDEVPPEIEAQFLKNIEEFENFYDNAKLVSIYQYIGKPAYRRTVELDPQNVKTELERILELLFSKNIVVDVLEEYEPSVIYNFITEELFFEKIRNISLPGYTVNFIYEEFHPNHKADIGNLAQEFIDHWFEKTFDEDSFELADELVTPEGKSYLKQHVITKLRNCLECYNAFNGIKFKGSAVHFDWDEAETKGLGHAEGVFKYVAEIEGGQRINIEGPFKLYMANEYGLWKIFYFVFPGFEWD